MPGNHDGENLPGDDSLTGFVRNFCAAHPVKLPESGDSHRTAMVQPNVYWTLLTPLASFVGLYSNVPEGGEIKAPQTEWLVEQLRTLPTDRPLFVSLHHPIYSADDHPPRLSSPGADGQVDRRALFHRAQAAKALRQTGPDGRLLRVRLAQAALSA